MTIGESSVRQQTDLPVGQIRFDVALVASLDASKCTQKRVRQKSNLSSRFNLISPVQISREK
jgi:hypothetical protein